MLSKKFRKKLNPFAERIGLLLLKLKLTPNFITFLGFVLIFPALYFFYFKNIFLASIFILLSGLMDVLDGALARVSKTTRLGEYLDAVTDKMVEGLIFLGVGFSFPEFWPLACLGVLSSILVSYTKHRVDKFNINNSVAGLERAERILILGFGILFSYFLPDPEFFVLIVLLFVIIGSFTTSLFQIFKAVKLLK